MKKVVLSVVLVCLLAVLAASCTKAAAQTSSIVRWEYKVLNMDRLDTSVADADALGAEGWELVTETQFKGYRYWTFKRRLP
jgi:hypothetical protein